MLQHRVLHHLRRLNFLAVRQWNLIISLWLLCAESRHRPTAEMTHWRRALFQRYCLVSALAVGAGKTALRSQNPYTVSPKLKFSSNSLKLLRRFTPLSHPRADATKHTQIPLAFTAEKSSIPTSDSPPCLMLMSTNVRSASDFVLSWVQPRLSASSDGRQITIHHRCLIDFLSETPVACSRLECPGESYCSIRLRVSEIGLRPDVDLTADWEERRSTDAK